MYNLDNLTHSIKMPKLVQMVAKYLIRYPKDCQETVIFCQIGEFSPNLVTLLLASIVVSHLPIGGIGT